MQDKFTILKKYFGYDTFRKGQDEIIDALLNHQDVMAIMPTGAGKSICYQVPAMLHPNLTIVISPLISLMKDQVTSLQQAGVPAAYLNSSLSAREQTEVLNNAKHQQYKLLYVAPEQLLTPRFLDFGQVVPIDFLCIDEAHCVSQWGQDFRPSYLQIPEFIATLPKRPIIGAFTATATQVVKEDIMKMLQLKQPFQLTTGFDRKNLYYAVQKAHDKLSSIYSYLEAHPKTSGIIYCSTRKNVEEVCQALNGQGFSATRYHAGLPAEERQSNQEAFVEDRIPIMVATNAFGMGIDKSNVSFVIHYNMPKNLESYYQEAGRAGRDGSPADCILYYQSKDVVTNQYFIDQQVQHEQMDEQQLAAFKQREQDRLKKMTYYCFTQDCLRHYTLNYFGEHCAPFCGNCSNCLSNFEKTEITIEAQKILSCIKRMNERFGIKMVVDVLRGSQQQKILQAHLDELSTYGIMKDTSEKHVRQMIEFLMAEGYLKVSDGQYPVLQLDFRWSEILIDRKQLFMNLVKEEEPVKKAKMTDDVAHPALFASLQILRREFADKQKIPAYMVFTDATLREMCHRLPQTPRQMNRINGVGEVKLEKYGEAFLQAISLYLSEQKVPSE